MCTIAQPSISSQNLQSVRKMFPPADSKTTPKQGEARSSCRPQRVYQSINELVLAMGGSRAIRRLLIANNGNAAIKAIRSLRSWSYSTFGNDRAVEIVIMATQDDVEANAEYISEGDYLVDVPAGPSANNFSNCQLIVQIALEHHCDAVWPGWGHASENARLPRLLTDVGIRWVGPSSASMLALGDKVGSTIIAQSVGVRCMPWSGDGLELRWRDCRQSSSSTEGGVSLRRQLAFPQGEGGSPLPDVSLDQRPLLSDGSVVQLPGPDLVLRATVSCAAEALNVVRRIGLPCVLKSSAGGGGKGIRKVFAEDEVADAFHQVIHEVRGGQVLVMKLLRRCKHLEVQVLCDDYGHTLSLGTRDCSIQRRCQKIIEEGPAIVAPPEVLNAMEEAAVKLCEAVGYTGAATVEFLYELPPSAADQEDDGQHSPSGTFYFLEVNARLQVEHVVTEELTGVNLPAAQLQIAMGVKLMDIPDVSRYVEFRKSRHAGRRHCIAARVTAEHAENGFKPTCGDVYEIQLRAPTNVWGYFSIGTKGRVHAYADSQIGHIFATGESRSEARRSLAITLKGLTVRGEIRTNVEALLQILESEDFVQNRTHTTWVEEALRFCSPQASLEPSSLGGRRLLQAVLLAAAFDAFCACKRSETLFLERIGQGQLPPLIKVSVTSELVYQDLKFELVCYQIGPLTILVELNGSQARVNMRPISVCDNSSGSSTFNGSGPRGTNARSSDDASSAACFLVSGGCDAKCRRVFYKVDNSGFRVTFDGITFTFGRELDPSQVRAPVSGRLSRWLIPSGSVVSKGHPYAEIEIMKIYMQLHVPETGVLSHALAEGAVFKAGDLLASLELGEDVKVIKPRKYAGTFPDSGYWNDGTGLGNGTKNNLGAFRAAYERLIGTLNGYHSDDTTIESALHVLVGELFSFDLPRLEVAEQFSLLDPYLPAELSDKLFRIIRNTHRGKVVGANGRDDCRKMPELFKQGGFPPAAERHDPIRNQGAGVDLNSSLKLSRKSNQSDTGKEELIPHQNPNGSWAHQHLLEDARTVLDALEEYLSKLPPDQLVAVQAQLQPFLESIRKYEHGLTDACVEILSSLLNHYLAIEEVFHGSTASGEASKILLKKRTEIEAVQLAVIARSHQALTRRTALIIKVLDVIYRALGSSELLAQFSEPLQRLSALTKPEYSEVSLRARQILLCRQQRSFLARTLGLIESLADYLERKQPPLNTLFGGSNLTGGGGGGGTSAAAGGSSSCYINAFGGGGAYSPTCAASCGKHNAPPTLPTPITPALLSVGFHPGSIPQQTFHGGTPAGCSSALQSFILDLEDAPDECLIVLTSHPSPSMRKVALEIFVRRTYERLGMTSLSIRANGDKWAFVGSSNNSGTGGTSYTVPGGSGLPALAGFTWGATEGKDVFRNETRSRQSWRAAAAAAASAVGVGLTAPAATTGGNTTPKSQGAFPAGLAANPHFMTTSSTAGFAAGGRYLDFFLQHQQQHSGGATGLCAASQPETHAPVAPAGRTTSCDALDACSAVPLAVGGSAVGQNHVKSAPSGRVQISAPLLAVWSHVAVLTAEFLGETCDAILAGRNGELVPARASGAAGAHARPSATGGAAVSRPEPTLTGVGQRTRHCIPNVKNVGASGSAGLDSGSRLHHMLSAFAFEGGLQGGRQTPLAVNGAAKLQTTVAMAFPTLAEFQSQFHACLDEYSLLQSECEGFTAGSSSVDGDGRMMLIFIADLELEDVGGAGAVPQLQSAVAPFTVELARLGFQLLGVVYLQDQPLLAQVRAEIHRHFIHGNLQAHTTNDPTPSSNDGSGGRINAPLYWKQWRSNSVDGAASAAVELGGSGGFRRSQAPGATAVSDLTVRGTNGDSPLSSPVRCQREIVGTAEDQLPGVSLPEFAADGLILPSAGDPANFGLLSQPPPRFAYFRNLTAIPCRVSSMSDAGSRGTRIGSIGDTISAAGDSAGGSAREDRGKVVTPIAKEPKYVEEALLRNVNPACFERLELGRLVNFKVRVEPTIAPNIALYEATPAQVGGLPRYFVRILLTHRLLPDQESSWNEQERHLVSALNALEMTRAGVGNRVLPSHHLLLSVVFYVTPAGGAAQLRLSPAQAEQRVRALARRYEERLMQNRVSTVEVRYAQRGSQISDTFVTIRLLINNPTGQSLRVQKFVEITDPTTGELIYSALDGSDSLAISATTSSRATAAGPAALFRRSATETATARSGAVLSLDGLPVSTPHPLSGPLEQSRALAATLGTVYVYDFLDLFEEAIKKAWRSCPKYFVPVFRGAEIVAEGSAGISDTRSARAGPLPTAGDCAASAGLGATAEGDLGGIGTKGDAFDSGGGGSERSTFMPDRVLESVELCIDGRGEVIEAYREPGRNTCGMVAWKLVMRTPEFPRGRRLIVIANDVTFHSGTFGVEEDLLFQRVSEIARRQGIPRVYIAVNSGARLGLAAEVQKLFRVEWVNSDDPGEGFKYLYLTEHDYKTLRASESVTAEPVHHPVYGKIYRITTVIGAQIGLGVENLCGSGAIAGETSKAYNETMTLAYVTGRTVGIGAYVTRLSQRVIQKAINAPILLTGYQALNRLNGRDVYNSNDALGGVDIMAKNGVSHLVVKNDFEGCEAILKWLSFIAERKEGPLPIMVDPTDPISRPVTYKVRSLTEDPRLCLTGCVDSFGRWLGGIFDRGSFCESQVDWAKSVIVGRARLGGIPVGVITVETRVTESITPADPAMSSSSEVKITRAGQVWYPDSAYKTAQAINDFNREEIPLIIFANWRGFSGGQRDMFHEVLKFGSFIVDALVDFKQPCVVYIPPKSELRGGAWVVVDPRINSHHMEMFAAPDCRGGVLEPTGTVEIRFRQKALVDLATRLDPVLVKLTSEDNRLAADDVARDGQLRKDIRARIEARLDHILPVYKQVAVHFADLHDTAFRMKRRAAIHEIVPWEKSRIFFYWRIRKQLVLFNLRSEIVKVCPTLTLSDAEELINSWALKAGHNFSARPANLAAALTQSSMFVQWACRALPDITRHLMGLRREYMTRILSEFSEEDSDLFIDAFKAAITTSESIAPVVKHALYSALVENLQQHTLVPRTSNSILAPDAVEETTTSATAAGAVSTGGAEDTSSDNSETLVSAGLTSVQTRAPSTFENSSNLVV